MNEYLMFRNNFIQYFRGIKIIYYMFVLLKKYCFLFQYGINIELNMLFETNMI